MTNNIALFLLFYFIKGSLAAHKAGYLYRPDTSKGEKPSDVSPVIDYVQPEKRIGEKQKDYQERVSHPLFLSKEETEDRIVEFYAAWCGHCQHYKPKYIQIAREVNQVRHLTFHAVPCPIHGQICKDQNVKGYPTVKFFPAGSDKGVDLKHNIDARSILMDYLDVDDNEVASKLAADKGKVRDARYYYKGKTATKQKTLHYSSDNSVFGDAALSFAYGLKSSATIPFDASRSKVLLRWLDLVIKSVPLEMSNVKDHVKILMTVDIDKTFQSEANLLQYLPDMSQVGWSRNCAKGVSGSGYTCGLWELFHIITIGVVEWNLLSSDRIATADAADVIRDYVEYFFMCDDCRKNFLTIYDACQFQRCERLTSGVSDDAVDSWKQLPLWLWETHNDVNVRLSAEERKDQGLTKASPEELQMARWPSIEDCPSCWLEGGGWDEDEIYNFLHLHYWENKSVVNINSAGKNTIRVSSILEFVHVEIILVSCCIVWFLYYRRQKRILVSVRRQKSN